MSDVAAKDSIIWTDDFLIGIAELDYEHRMLIKDINLLHQELSRHDSQDKIKDTLGDIHARMQAHFALEEHFMLENNYPHYIEHKTEHNDLLDEYTGFLVHFESEGDTPSYLQAEEILNRWIVDHIVTSDKKMSRTIR
ncbi:MAG: bacteriohemerythrin [Rhodospirillaceae bacterium]|nr:bacteriohemerythrin [Rhodospirillaceae bacterium]MBL6929899.1 bacteriohemerythrin [Rhodospirillales bacterium]MBL6941619.1 bacteriohemerythrin [Rhodospirillales bacterium]